MPDFDLDAALNPAGRLEGEPKREYPCSLGTLVNGRAGRDGAAHYQLKTTQPLPRGYKAKVERAALGSWWTLRVFDADGDHYFVESGATLEDCLRRFGILMNHGDW